MAMIDTTLSNFFAGAATVLTNAKEQPEIAAALEAFGYDAAAIQEGQALFDTARSLYDAQIKEYGEQHAATQAFKDACEKASPVLLEPYMRVEVVVPEEFVGEVIADLNSRRGKLDEVIPRGKTSMVNAVVPLAAMFGYSTALRSLSQGRGIFTMQYSHYDAKD